MKKFRPDFDQFLKAIYCQPHNGTPYAEFIVDKKFWPRLIKREVYQGTDVERRIRDAIDYRLACGCDYICLMDYDWMLKGPYPEKHGTSYSSGSGSITSREQIDALDWSFRNDIGLVFNTMERMLPDNMKIIVDSHQIFDAVWMFMGWEDFSVAVAEDGPLINYFFNRLMDHLLVQLEQIAKERAVGALWHCDDIAYTGGLMCSPLFFREFVYPGFAKIGAIAKKNDLPLLFHSDGNLVAAIDDLLACGINAIHPFEPKAIDIFNVKRNYGEKLCTIGNVEVDTLCSGTPQECRKLTIDLLEGMSQYHGYCLSSSNTIPNYANEENFIEMLRTYFDFNGWDSSHLN